VIEVRSPGLFTTVQDLGREGFGPLGVSASGAADPIALRLGNRLVGNAEGRPALEMTLLGGAYLFRAPALFVLAGSQFDAALDGASVAVWQAHEAKARQTLRVGPTHSGARCYLCVRGGFEVPAFLGSASTHILSGLGGFHGRALRKGDLLPFGKPDADFPGRVLSPQVLSRLSPRKQLRVTRGAQGDWFAEDSWRVLLGSPYRVSEESNRMGLRLEGPALEASGHGHMVTEGVPLGAIQIPAGGQPIILFVEQQTTGGYPKIANIIAADLASVGQLRPRDEIRFAEVTPEEARDLIREQEALLTSDAIFELHSEKELR
jgi:antagonist of KipI